MQRRPDQRPVRGHCRQLPVRLRAGNAGRGRVHAATGGRKYLQQNRESARNPGTRLINVSSVHQVLVQ